MNISYHDDIIYTATGEIFNPLILSFAVIINKLVLVSIGIPFNLLTVIPLINHPRLNKKPRNVFQSGIAISYLSFFLIPIIELVYHLLPAEFICQIFIATMFVPQACLLINCLLALIDRSIAMAYPLKHREKMTCSLARYIVFICSIMIIAVVKFVYISDTENLHCELWLNHIRMSLIILIVLLVLCLLLNFYVYKQTMIHLTEARNIRLGVSTGGDISDHSTASESLSVHISRRKFNEMELEANLTLVISVSSLCIMPFIGICFVISFLTCQFFYGESECSGFTVAGPYIRDISLSPAIYGPIIFLARNKEFRHVYQCQRKTRVTANFD